MSSRKIKKDFLPYRDKYGLNQLTTDGQQGHISQNGALFTMEYLLCYDNIPKEEINRLKEVYASLEILSGLSKRFPDSGEFDSMDNNGVNLVFSAIWGNKEFAKRMRAHGTKIECDGIDNIDHDKNNRYLNKA